MLVADDDPIVRRVIRTAMEAAGLEVVGEACDAAAGLTAARTSGATVALVDVDLPAGGAVDFVRQAVSEQLPVKVIVMSPAEVPHVAVAALRAGASGYLAKDLPMDVLPRIVEAVASGERAVSRGLIGALVDALRDSGEGRERFRPVHSPLTDREWQVLDLLCEGKGTEAIADRLVLSRETVRSHIKRMNRKLGVTSRAEAVAAAGHYRAGITPIDAGASRRHAV